MQKLTSIKLFKDGINMHTSAGIFRASSTAGFIAELMDAVNAHANYRFILRDELTGKPKLLLWVLNWKVYACGVSVGEDCKKVELKEATKVLYKQCSGTSVRMEDVELLGSWEKDVLVENLVYTDSRLVQIYLAFSQNNRQLPMAQRLLNGFNVALVYN